jgi:hypothetical protein
VLADREISEPGAHTLRAVEERQSTIGIVATARRLRVRLGGVRWMPPCHFPSEIRRFAVRYVPPNPPGFVGLAVRLAVNSATTSATENLEGIWRTVRVEA